MGERLTDRRAIKRLIIEEIEHPHIDLPHIINRLKQYGVYEEDVRSVAWSMIDIDINLERDWSLTIKEN